MSCLKRFIPYVALVACLLITGCSTPKSARDLAAQGAVVVDKAQTETTAFVERATQSYRRREAIVQELAKGEIADTSAGAFNSWLANEAGFPNDQERANLIKKIAEQSHITREQRQAEVDKKRAEVAAAFGDPAKAPVKALGDAKKAFLVLAQELTAQEWLDFTRAYVKQLQSDLKKLESLSGDAEAAK
jgi:predicted HAD superfamily phosphohydrolase